MIDPIHVAQPEKLLGCSPFRDLQLSQQQLPGELASTFFSRDCGSPDPDGNGNGNGISTPGPDEGSVRFSQGGGAVHVVSAARVHVRDTDQLSASYTTGPTTAATATTTTSANRMPMTGSTQPIVVDLHVHVNVHVRTARSDSNR